MRVSIILAIYQNGFIMKLSSKIENKDKLIELFAGFFDENFIKETSRITKFVQRKSKLHYDLLSQEILDTTLQNGTTPDCKYPLHDLRANDLRLEDLGYFKVERVREIEKTGAFFPSRLKFGEKNGAGFFIFYSVFAPW